MPKAAPDYEGLNKAARRIAQELYATRETQRLIERMEVDVAVAERRVAAQQERVTKTETAHRFAVTDLTEEQIKLENAKVNLENAKQTRPR